MISSVTLSYPLSLRESGEKETLCTSLTLHTYLAIARANCAQAAEEVSRPAKRPRLESVVRRYGYQIGCLAKVARPAGSVVSADADAVRAGTGSGEGPIPAQKLLKTRKNVKSPKMKRLAVPTVSMV